jgi:hypothetical protein
VLSVMSRVLRLFFAVTAFVCLLSAQGWVVYADTTDYGYAAGTQGSLAVNQGSTVCNPLVLEFLSCGSSLSQSGVSGSATADLRTYIMSVSVDANTQGYSPTFNSVMFDTFRVVSPCPLPPSFVCVGIITMDLTGNLLGSVAANDARIAINGTTAVNAPDAISTSDVIGAQILSLEFVIPPPGNTFMIGAELDASCSDRAFIGTPCSAFIFDPWTLTLPAGVTLVSDTGTLPSIETTTTSEPSTLLLLGTGLLSFVPFIRRRFKLAHYA